MQASFSCRNSGSTCPQAVRRDGSLPRAHKEAEFHVLLKHVQLAADITEVPGGTCERQLITARLFLSPWLLISIIQESAASSSSPFRPIGVSGNSWLRQSQTETQSNQL